MSWSEGGQTALRRGLYSGQQGDMPYLAHFLAGIACKAPAAVQTGAAPLTSGPFVRGAVPVPLPTPAMNLVHTRAFSPTSGRPVVLRQGRIFWLGLRS